MSDPITICRTVDELRRYVGEWRAAGLRTGFVPTMGALHAGHLSLVSAALARSERVVVSIFVNPAQFGPGEDFGSYPRHEEDDCRQLAEAGAHLVFMPDVNEMYPAGSCTTVHVAGLTDNLEGAFRPGHFDGVTTIVAKLLLQCQPDLAVFGEKDYQQLAVIRQMVRDLCIPAEIIGAPLMRDEHGLALSSRNAYLRPDNLAAARQLNKILYNAAAQISGTPGDVAGICEKAKRAILEAGFESVDYLTLVDASSLKPLAHADCPARLLVTARIQGVRLLDNVAVEGA
jgi:pantoate--beta-alanine ligase